MKCINTRSVLAILVSYSMVSTSMEVPRDPEIVVALKGHHSSDSLCYTPNGKFLAAGILRKEQPQCLLKVWNTLNNLDATMPHATMESFAPTTSVDAHPNNKELVTANMGELIFWNIETGQKICAIDQYNKEYGEFKKVRYNADGSLVLAALKDGGCQLYDPRLAKYVRILEERVNNRWVDRTFDAQWNPGSNNEVVSCSSDAKARVMQLWDLRKPETTLWAIHTDDAYYSLAFHPNGKCIAAGGTDQIAVYDTKSLLIAAYSTLGKKLPKLSTYDERRAKILSNPQAYDASSRNHIHAIHSIQYSPINSDVIVFGTSKGAMTFCDTQNPNKSVFYVDGASQVDSIALHPDGQTMAVSIKDGFKNAEIRILDITQTIQEKVAPPPSTGWGSYCDVQ